MTRVFRYTKFVSLIILLLLSGCSGLMLSEPTPTPEPVRLFVPPTPTPPLPPTATPILMPTSAPVVIEEPSPIVEEVLVPATDGATGEVINGGNLRSATTIADDTVLGQVCPGDRVVFLDQQADWYRIRIIATANDCVPERVAIGTEGWLHRTLVSTPSDIISPGAEVAIPTATTISAPTNEIIVSAATPTPILTPTHEVAIPTPESVMLTPEDALPSDVVNVESVANTSAIEGFVGIVDHTHGGNLRTAPSVVPETVLGHLCPGDEIMFLEEQEVAGTLWYRIRVTNTHGLCTQQRVAVHTEGWASHLLVSDPQPPEVVAIASTDRTQTFVGGGRGAGPGGCPTAEQGIFGLNTHIASRYKDNESLDIPVRIVAEAGVRWAREDFQWYRVQEAPGVYDWEYTDKTVDLMYAHGINVIGVFNSAVGWATPFPSDPSDDISFYEPDHDLFTAFIYETVSRYRGRVCYWEIWNEPEHPYFWLPAPDPVAYSRMLKVIYPAIKAADPNAQVLLAGTVPFGLHFLRTVAEQGAWDSFDILSLHPFIDPVTPEDGQIGANGVGEVQTLFHEYAEKPIWVTEYGWASGPGDHNRGMGVDEETQADYLIRAGMMLHAAGAERVFWYTLKDTELRNGAPFNQYGLLRYGSHIDDYSQPKAGLHALRVLNEQLQGAQLMGSQNVGNRQVVLDFETCGVWQSINAQHGELRQSDAYASNGDFSAAITYHFPPPGGNYVAFVPEWPIELPGAPGQLGMWVYGDGSGHALLVQLEDAEGEKLQYRLGTVGATGWQFLIASLTGEVSPGNQISGPGSGNMRLDYPARLIGIVLGDEAEGRNPDGTIYLDDLTVVSGSEAYVVRFAKEGGEVLDVLWSPRGAQIVIPTISEVGRLVTRDGEETMIGADDGQFVINLGPAPLYHTYQPGDGPPTVQG